MSERELQIEWEYRFQERLAIMCGADIPTDEQFIVAHEEATQAVAQLLDGQQS